MSAPPYMKLYVGDYLGDTHHLTVVEHGAYLLLLMAMWRTGGSLPAADSNLARLAKCTPDQWAEIREVIMPLFKRRGGRITQKRLASEMAKYDDTSGKRSEAGKKGASRKANKNNGAALANASGAESNCQHNQNQNQNHTSEGKPSAELFDFADPAKLAWDMAGQLLTERGGMTLPKAKAFFGKLLRDNGIEARELMASLAQAVNIGTRDPQGYLTKAAQAVSSRKTPAEKRVGFV